MSQDTWWPWSHTACQDSICSETKISTAHMCKMLFPDELCHQQEALFPQQCDSLQDLSGRIHNVDPLPQQFLSVGSTAQSLWCYHLPVEQQ